MTRLNYEMICHTRQAKASLICLHGLGASGHDLMDFIRRLKFNQSDKFRYIFPHAPKRNVSICHQMMLNAWYDIYGLEKHSRQDEIGIQQAIQWINEIIEQEHQQNIPYDHIFLSGFSQGGALALATGIQSIYKLGGMIALSTYLPIADKLLSQRLNINKPPIFIAHGREDTVVPFEFGQLAYWQLQQHQYDISWFEYPIGHQIGLSEINDIANWLEKRLPHTTLSD